jgi:VCBS repeat-containing protein
MMKENDMAFDLSALSNKEAVTAIYVGYFNRAPDPEGLQYWINELNTGSLTLAGIAKSFSVQPETTSLYPFLTTPDIASATTFITSIYLNLFNRTPDPEGLNYWVGEVNATGADLGQIILNIISGAQGSDITIVQNKIEAGCDFAANLAEAGLIEFDDGVNDAAEMAAAKDVLSGVTDDPATVTDAATKTDDFVSEATNTAPVATAVAIITNEDGPLTGSLSAAASDADSDTLTFSKASDPSHGTVTISANGAYTYTPTGDYNGQDSFTYTVDDGRGGVSTETVTVTVNAVNDTPVAASSATATQEDSAVNGSVSATDIDGDSLVFSVTAGGQPANGSVAMNADGTYTYTPNADFSGTDTFTYTVTDNAGANGTTTATVTVTVKPVNDAPVGTTPASFTGNEDAVITGAVTATDVDGDVLSYTKATTPSNGTVTVDTDGTFSYTPNANFNGTDTFDVTVTDGTVTITETVTINVLPVNDAPVASALAGSTFEDVAFTGQVAASDIDGDALTYTVATQPAEGGSVSMNPDGSFTLTPTPNFNGQITFTYSVTDGTVSDTETVTIEVTPVDDVLTTGTDVIVGVAAGEVVLGTEATLNGGDNIDGAGGDDTVFITTSGDANLSGFVLNNVETLQVTSEGDASDNAVYDLSSSDDILNLKITNSTADTTFNFANLNADADGDGRAETNLIIDRATNGVDVTLDVRNGNLTGNDEVNVTVNDSDADDIDVDELQIDSGIGHVDLVVSGNVTMDAIIAGTTPATSGFTTMTISSGAGDALQIGSQFTPLLDDPTSGGVQNSDPSSFIDSDVEILGISNAGFTGGESLAQSLNTVDASGAVLTGGTGSAGSIILDFNDDATGAGVSGGGASFFGGTGTDMVEGTDGGDMLKGNDGNDTLDGEDGADSLAGDAGDDFLIGGDGNDTLMGGDDNDVLLGGEDSDSLFGGAGDDYIDTGDTTNAGVEFVDAGTGSDQVWTRGENLVGRSTGASLSGVDQLDGGTDGAGPDAAGNDVLNIIGSSGDTRGLNDVQGFEQINLGNNASDTFDFTIDNNSVFEGDHDGTSGPTIISGKESGSTRVDASTLDSGIGLAGGDGIDTLMGGAGADTIAGDADNFGSDGGNDVLSGNAGDDTFIFDAYELTAADSVSGGADNDTISIEDRGSSTMSAGVSGVENLVVAASYSDFTTQLQGTSGDLSGDFTLTLDASFNSNMNIDASALDVAGENFVLNAFAGSNTNLTVTGGVDADTFNMGNNLTSADVINGGDGEDTITISSNAGGDADFTGVSNVECLVLNADFAGTLTLGAEAFEAGFTKIDASAVTGPFTIDASGFGGPLTIIDSQLASSDSTITGTAFDDTIVSGEGTDTTNGGGGNDVLQVAGGDLDSTDTLNGVETVTLMNTTETTNIKALINLDNVTGLQTVNMEGTGIETGGNVGNSDSVTFQGGTVGTVTPIAVDASNVTDTSDTLSVIIDGASNPGGPEADVDADYSFNITGGAGVDNLLKYNEGINNDINWNGGTGADNVSIFAGDLGASTTIDGGANDDTITQLENGVAFSDDDFVNVSNVEGLVADSGAAAAVMATLGAQADEAGIVSIMGGQGDEMVTLDAAFDNDLDIDLNAGGDDTINAGASASALNVFAEFPDLTAADVLTGGTGNMDTLNLHVGNGTADATNVNGFEIINLTESASGPGTLILGTQNTALTINENSGNPFDDETFNLEAENYAGDITYNGNTNPGDGANGTLTTGSGNDSINAGNFNDTVIANGGNDTVDGGAGNDEIMGGLGTDLLMGGIGNDTIDGGIGNDTIDGGDDDDVITGGAGSDNLTGGDGEDSFRYANVSDSAGGVSLRDVITDFDVLLDTICVEESMLQEFAGVTGIQFVGTEEFFSDAQGTVSLAANVGNGLADIVFESGLNKLWIDIDDNGILNGQDVQITLDGVTTGLTGANFKLVDTVSPDAPTIVSVTDDSAIAGDFITNDADGVTVTVGFSNATDGTGAAVGDTITLTVPGLGGSPFTSAPLTAGQIAAGQIDFALPTAGNYTGTLSAVVNDTFGDMQTSAAATQLLVVDSTAPTIAINTVEGDGVINAAEDDDVTISGTTTGVEDGQMVSVTINGGAAIMTTVTGNAWTLADQDLTGLADGVVSITADVMDVAGNAAVQATATPAKDTAAVINVTGLINETTVDNIVSGAEDTGGAIALTGTVTDIENSGVTSVSVTITDPNGGFVVGYVLPIAGGTWTTPAFGANLFSLDGTYTASVSSTDLAGNTATSSFDFEVDETGPVYSIDSIVYDETAGTITINGDFSDVEVTDTIDVSQATWQDGATGPIGADHADFTETTTNGAATNWYGDDTQLVLTWDGAAQGTFEGAATVGGAVQDLLDFGAGTLVDDLGNQSLAATGNVITLHISTAVQGVAALTGFGGDDVLTANNATGDTLTGGAGADSFHIDDATFTANTGGTISATVTDFNLSEGDTLSFSAADLNGLLAGTPFADGDDGSEIAFLTFDSSAGVTFEAGVGGAFIFDVDNNQLRFDIDGQTSFNGSAVDPTGADDDIVIQLTGVTALTAADVHIIA